MRAQREKAQLLKQGGADKDDILNARCKYQAMLDEYSEFSKKFNLPEQRERIYYDLRGRVAPSQRTYKKWQEDQLEKKLKREAEKARREERARQRAAANATMKNKRETIQELSKLKQSGIAANEYAEYLNMINTHRNTDIIRLYKGYADNINSVRKTSASGTYYPGDNRLDFDYPRYSDMNKYGTLAHEYGHFFDVQAGFSNLTFKEMEAVRKATGLDRSFPNIASSSDKFLSALRKDKQHIKDILTAEAKADLAAHNSSSGVQDAIDGLFPKSRIRCGHGEKYYNRKYSAVESMDKIIGGTMKNYLQQVYKDLGLDASSQAKTKVICRQYETASEVWANIMSAEVCGGESLEYVKKYLPNSYETMLEILKGVN